MTKPSRKKSFCGKTTPVDKRLGRVYLSSLQIQHFRYLQSNKLALNPRFNVFYGENGSGKTSIVEAIVYLKQQNHPNPHLLQISDVKEKDAYFDTR